METRHLIEVDAAQMRRIRRVASDADEAGSSRGASLVEAWARAWGRMLEVELEGYMRNDAFSIIVQGGRRFAVFHEDLIEVEAIEGGTLRLKRKKGDASGECPTNMLAGEGTSG